MRVFNPFYIKTKSFAGCIYDFSAFEDDFWAYSVTWDNRNLILRHIFAPFEFIGKLAYFIAKYQISKILSHNDFTAWVKQQSIIIFTKIHKVDLCGLI